jgi:ABC-2 type transport system permease protein
MIATIARKEFTEMVRDGRFRWAAAIVFALLIASLLTGWQHHRERQRQRASAEESQRAFWLEQGEKNPHSAAHYGTYVFKPHLPLAAIDRGLNSYLGVSQFLEAHRQNSAQFRPVEDATPLQRFGELTAAATLQMLVPLLIILLGYNAFAGEREGRTLRQLLSLGVSRNQLALGKALGMSAPLVLLLVPVAVIGALALVLNSGGAGAGSNLARAAIMAATYLAYFIIFIGLALIVSAKAASSRSALIVLLGFWFVNSFVAGRVVTDLARAAYPTPSALAFDQAIADEIRSHDDWEARVEKTTKELLARYEVADAKDLPVHPEAVVLDEGEKIDTEVNAKHFGRLHETYARQQRTYQLGAVFAPLLAVQSLSMGMAGTDLAQHRHFAAAAEQYREQLVGILNGEMLAKGNVEEIWKLKSGRALWEKVPPFQYHSPGAGWAFRHHWIGSLMLALWLAAVAVAAPFALRGLRID